MKFNQKGYTEIVTVSLILGIIGAIFIAGVFVWQEINTTKKINKLISTFYLEERDVPILSVYDFEDIEDIFYFSDGGTTGVKTIKDNGEYFEFCFDGRMQAISFEDYMAGIKPDKKHFFVNVTHPDTEGAIEIGIDSPEELNLINAMNNWLEINYTTEQIKQFYESESIRDFEEEDYNGYRIVNILKAADAR